MSPPLPASPFPFPLPVLAAVGIPTVHAVPGGKGSSCSAPARLHGYWAQVRMATAGMWVPLSFGCIWAGREHLRGAGREGQPALSALLPSWSRTGAPLPPRDTGRQEKKEWKRRVWGGDVPLSREEKGEVNTYLLQDLKKLCAAASVAWSESGVWLHHCTPSGSLQDPLFSLLNYRSYFVSREEESYGKRLVFFH